MEETVILNIQVDGSESIDNLTKANRELRKERNALNLATEEGRKRAQEINTVIDKNTEKIKVNSSSLEKQRFNVGNYTASIVEASRQIKKLDEENKKLDQSLKKVDKTTEEGRKEYQQINQAIQNNITQINLYNQTLNKQSNTFSNVADNAKKAASEIKVAGVSLGDIGTKLTSFLNPVTATLGLVTGLAAAYTSSARGAKDLEQAQRLLSYSFAIVNEGLAEFISGTQEGEGILSTLASAILFKVSPALFSASLAASAAAETLKQLEVSRAFAAGSAKDDERRAEIQRRIRDDENEALERRLETTEKIDQILTQSGQRTKIVIEAQIEAIKRSTIGYESNRQAQLEVAQLAAEIKDKEEEITGKLTENVTARRNILKLLQEQRKLTAEDDRAQRRAISGQTDLFQVGGEVDNSITEEEQAQAAKTEALIEGGQEQISIQEQLNRDILKINKKFYEDDLKNKQNFAELKKRVDEAQLASAATIAGAAASLFDQQSSEYKIFATAQTLISTYATAQKAYEAAFTPPTIASPALAAGYVAAAIATGLANVAQINGIGFADGGWTGPGQRNQVAGMVHADEYVIPKHIVNSPAAQPHISAVESMRVKGYADGGFVTNQNTGPAQQALIVANAIKNIPPGYIAVTEFNKVARRVEVRESISSI
jgi:hypothetical protein